MRVSITNFDCLEVRRHDGNKKEGQDGRKVINIDTILSYLFHEKGLHHVFRTPYPTSHIRSSSYFKKGFHSSRTNVPWLETTGSYQLRDRDHHMNPFHAFQHIRL